MEEEKVFVLFWNVQEDQIYIKFARKDADRQFLEDDCSSMVPKSLKIKLTIIITLSFHAKTHDPIGLVIPTCMTSALLFRVSMQLIKKKVKGKIPWTKFCQKIQWFTHKKFCKDLQQQFKKIESAAVEQQHQHQHGSEGVHGGHGHSHSHQRPPVAAEDIMRDLQNMKVDGL